MNLYIDDDTAKGALVARLKKEGHQVVVPADVSLSGAADPRHLLHAVENVLHTTLGTSRYPNSLTYSNTREWTCFPLNPNAVANIIPEQIPGRVVSPINPPCD